MAKIVLVNRKPDAKKYTLKIITANDYKRIFNEGALGGYTHGYANNITSAQTATMIDIIIGRCLMKNEGKLDDVGNDDTVLVSVLKENTKECPRYFSPYFGMHDYDYDYYLATLIPKVGKTEKSKK